MTRIARMFSRLCSKFLGRKPARRVARVSLGLGLMLLSGWLALRFVPLPPALFTNQHSELEFLDRTGRPLRIVRSDEDPFGRPIAYADIPRPLIEATLAAEDKRFLSHHGVD